MKSIALLASTTMVFALAFAQAPQTAVPVAAKPAAQAPKAAATPAKPMSAERKARRSEDARHCLERPNNNEIIKCAEAYL